ncbi:MAG: glycosyltransferase, partial [Pseudomonadota bacterium]
MHRPAIIIERIGPYHQARLRALCEHAEALLALEVVAKDETYDWQRVDHDNAYERVTLFKTEAEARNTEMLRTKVWDSLDAFQPSHIAVPGWGDPSALTALAWARRAGVPSIMMSDSQYHDLPRRGLSETVKRFIVSNASAGFVAGRTHREYMARLGMSPD